MPSPSVDIAQGLTIVFATSGFSAQLLDITLPSWARESIDTTHQGTTTAKTFMPSDLYDGGEFSFGFHFNPDTVPPMTGSTETVTITSPEGATWVFSAFMTGYEASAPLGDKMTGTATCKVSGEIAQTGA